MAILLDLPIPPSINSYWRRGPNTSRVAPEGAVVTHISKEGRDYRKDVAAAWIGQRNRTPLCGPLVLRGWIWFSQRGSDVDNRIKPLLDALEEAGCFENDSQIASVSFRRMDQTMKPGSLIVHIEHDVGCRTSYADLWAALSSGSRIPMAPGGGINR